MQSSLRIFSTKKKLTGGNRSIGRIFAECHSGQNYLWQDEQEKIVLPPPFFTVPYYTTPLIDVIIKLSDEAQLETDAQ